MDQFYLSSEVFCSTPAVVYANPASPIPPNNEFYSGIGYRQEALTYPYAFSQHTIHPPPRTVPIEESGTYLPLRDTRGGKSREVPLAVLSRRRAQNRDSQRAYRKRKDNHIRNLETRLSEMKGKYETLVEEHERFTAEYEKVRNAMQAHSCENERLKYDWRGEYANPESRPKGVSVHHSMSSPGKDGSLDGEYLGFEG